MVAEAIEAYKAVNVKPYIIPILPGSAPSYLFTRKLGIPFIATGPGHGGELTPPTST
ncbi:MAG: hypothetical protein P3X22_002865 [Thermoprotei archaeon]|nr:hypothetical protein [Thermoprotei archaeon]